MNSLSFLLDSSQRYNDRRSSRRNLSTLRHCTFQVPEAHVYVSWACSFAHTPSGHSTSSELQLLHSPGPSTGSTGSAHNIPHCHTLLLHENLLWPPVAISSPWVRISNSDPPWESWRTDPASQGSPLATVTQLSRCSHFFSQSCLQLASKFKQRDVFN